MTDHDGDDDDPWAPTIGIRPRDPYPGRRQVDDLTAADLDATPAWWFPPPNGRLDGPDAGTVMPITEIAPGPGGVVEFPDGRYLLAATFTLADGTEMTGHVTYATGETVTIETQEPTICTPSGQVPLWHGSLVPEPARIAAMLAALGRSREAAFPIRWHARLRRVDHAIVGSTPDFATS